MLFPGLVADQGVPAWAIDLDEWFDFTVKRSRFAAYSGLNDFWDGGYLLNNSNIYEPRSSTELALTDNGLHTAVTRTNKLTNYNANPTNTTGMTKLGAAAATLTVVDDTVALALAGLIALCSSGKVYKLDNSAGASLATARITVSEPISGPHVSSFYARRTGSGAVAFGMSETAVRGSIPAGTTAYERFTAYDPDGSGNLVLTAEAGDVVWFILNQLEEGEFVTSPIITLGSGTQRVGNRQIVSTGDGNRAFAVDVFLREPIDGLTTRTLLNWNNGSATDYRALELTASGILQVVQRGASASETVSTGLPLPDSGPLRIYGVITEGWMKVGAVDVGEAGGMTAMGNEPHGINTLAIGGLGLSTAENTFVRTRRYGELRNINNPTVTFDKMKSIAQQWAV